MLRTLSAVLGAAALFGLSSPRLNAQEIPGVRATLTLPHATVASTGNVELRLLLDVVADAEVPMELLSGTSLDVKVDDKPGPHIAEKGKNTTGTVALLAGTRIERTVSLPAARFVPNTDSNGFAAVSVSWTGLAGTSCVFKVAPDASKIDLSKLDMAKTKVVLLTNLGEMTLSFRPDKAPQTVENFLKLCKSGFYDGTKFHRVIRDFMIQGGDPYTKDDKKQAMWGQGDPGYKIKAEFSDLKHVRGTLSMARASDPDSAGSQFFIVHKDSTHLDGQYTAFGSLESGADTLDRIANTAVGGPQRSTPVSPVVLEAAVILPVMK